MFTAVKAPSGGPWYERRPLQHNGTPLTPLKGAGVSKAAGIQPFRGSGGLLSVSTHSGEVLDLFDKDTFQVWRRLVLVLSL
jgi:NAD-dependent SIR2 family protein deacetylase